MDQELSDGQAVGGVDAADRSLRDAATEGAAFSAWLESSNGQDGTGILGSATPEVVIGTGNGVTTIINVHQHYWDGVWHR